MAKKIATKDETVEASTVMAKFSGDARKSLLKSRSKKTATKKVAPKAPVSDYWKQQEEEEAERQKAVQAFRAAFNPDDTIDVSTVLAEYMKDAKCGHLALQWAIDKFWALRMPAIMDNLNRIYAKLVKDKITEKNAISFNDSDDKVWYEPCRGKKVLVHTTQNTNYLYIWRKDDEKVKPGALGAGLISERGMRKLDVRKFYYRYDDPRYERATDKYEREEDEAFKKKVAKEGRQAAIKEMWLLENYADDGVQYPRKLSLLAYRALQFEPRYHDARDPGYVLSWDEFGQKVDNAMYQHELLHIMEDCFMPCLISAVFDEEQ